MNLEQLIKPSRFHKAVQLAPNVFRIEPANQNEDCLEGFHTLVVEAIKTAPSGSYEIKAHSSDVDPKGRYDSAIITITRPIRRPKG